MIRSIQWDGIRELSLSLPHSEGSDPFSDNIDRFLSDSLPFSVSKRIRLSVDIEKSRGHQTDPKIRLWRCIRASTLQKLTFEIEPKHVLTRVRKDLTIDSIRRHTSVTIHIVLRMRHNVFWMSMIGCAVSITVLSLKYYWGALERLMIMLTC